MKETCKGLVHILTRHLGVGSSYCCVPASLQRYSEVFNGSYFTWKPETSADFPGTVLFNIFICDLEDVARCVFIMFSGDTKVVMAAGQGGGPPEILHPVLGPDIDKLE